MLDSSMNNTVFNFCECQMLTESQTDNKPLKTNPDNTQQVAASEWRLAAVRAVYEQPLMALLSQAHQIHAEHFNENHVQLSTLLNIKTGGCPEDCAYCPQSAHHSTPVKAEPLLDVEAVRSAAKAARDNGASRFCMGAAWRSPKEKDFVKVLELVKEVKALGLESCLTMGMLSQDQAQRLKQVGLDYYNHNLDSSQSFYESIISTRDYEDRLETLEHVRASGLNMCCGGIIGMGESIDDRLEMLMTLANMEQQPESVPINQLVKVEGTPLSNQNDNDVFDIVRLIATARIMMPGSWLRLSAGRDSMSDELQAMCFFAGANSIFYGDKLLTTDNPEFNRDQELFKRLGIISV